MKEYTIVFLFTGKRAASDVGFGAVRDAGVRNLWKLSWVADLELPEDPIRDEPERTRLYAYAGTVKPGISNGRTEPSICSRSTAF